MNILWIPHKTWLNVQGITRDKHFIRNLKNKHEIHVIQYTQPFENTLKDFFNPKFLLNSMRDWTIYKEGLYHHHIRHIYFTRSNQALKFNNRLFKRKIKKLVKEYGIEVIICGPSHYLHGYPPANLNIPIIFDYVDFLHDFSDPNKEDRTILNGYYKSASKILCVSKTLVDSIPLKYRDIAFYLPNGVDLNFFKSYKYSRREDNTKYISLIGISISESLFYLDIFPQIKEKIENVKLMLVGGGPRYSLIEKYIKKKKNPSDYILTGYVPYSKIRDYFYMSDIGLYPTLKNRYYDSACPMKVFEYSAVSKPVVSTNLEELQRLNFPNVFLAKPTAEDFIEKILQAFNYNGDFLSLQEFTWQNLSKKLHNLLKNI